MLVDSVLLATVAIVAAATHRNVVAWIAEHADLGERVAFVLFVVVACAIAGLFAVGIARGAVRLAWLLATAVIPGGYGGHDLGRSPRRALLLTLELAIVVTLGLPIAAVIQPLIPGGGFALLGMIAIFAIFTRRSIEDFEKHVRAGSALILEVLARQSSEKSQPELSEVEAVLPGFQGLTPIALPGRSARDRQDPRRARPAREDRRLRAGDQPRRRWHRQSAAGRAAAHRRRSRARRFRPGHRRGARACSRRQRHREPARRALAGLALDAADHSSSCIPISICTLTGMLK